MRRFPWILLLAVGLPLFFSACATIAPPQPPSLDLPKPPADLRAVRKGDKVTLTWTVPSSTTDRQTMHSVGPTRICRGLESQMRSCGTPVGEAPLQKNLPTRSSKQKVTASYTDTLPVSAEGGDPAAFITYAVEVLNSEARGAGISNQVRVPLIRTLPPPWDFAARVSDSGVVLNWTSDLPATTPEQAVRYLFRIYRRLEGSQQSILAGEIPAGEEHEFTLTDSSIEWEKTYEYRAEMVTVISRDGKPALTVDGDDTAEVKVFAHDIFPPAVPSGLQAVFSGPGQRAFIDLVWAPVTDVDLDGYNVYRHEEGAAPVKLNAAPVKTPAYRDEDVASGKRYLYSVTAVDVRGNESARSEEAGESVP